jgi:hypothetical protein
MFVNVFFAFILYRIGGPGGETNILWMASVMGLVFNAVILINLYKTIPYIVINNEGIYLRQRGGEVFRWNVIQDVYIMEPDFEGLTFLNLVVDEKYLPFIGKWYEKFVSYQDNETAIEKLNYPLDDLDVDKKKLLNLIKGLIHSDEIGREVLLKTGITTHESK